MPKRGKPEGPERADKSAQPILLSRPSAAAGSKKRDPKALVNKLPSGKTPEEGTAGLVSEGLVSNTLLLHHWATPIFGEIDVTALQNSMDNVTMAVARGSLAGAEELLMAQAISLNAVYANLATRAQKSTFLDHVEIYMRLALKAQTQCRSTCETLAVLKNPPLFTKQANIAAGSQQVNNGPVLNATPTRAALSETVPDKLLEAHGERVDGGTAAAAGGRDPALAAVGALNGPANSTGKGASLSERLPGRRACEGSRAR